MTEPAKPTGRALTVMNELVRAGVQPDVAEAQVIRMGLPGAPRRLPSPAEVAETAGLSESAKAIYGSWREVGHSHEQAMAEVRTADVDGISEAEFHAKLGHVFTGPAGARPVQEFERPAGGGISEAEFDHKLGLIFGTGA